MLLLLFGRRGDIYIHLDVCVDEIWILEIELRHHAALRSLPRSLLVQASAFRNFMMVRMRRQRAVADISLSYYLHRQWSLSTLHHVVLMMVMPNSISCVVTTSDMPNWLLWNSTTRTHWLSITAIWILNGMIVLIGFHYLHLLLGLMLQEIFRPTCALMINRLLHLVILEVAKWHWGKALFPLISLSRIKLLKVLSNVSLANEVSIFSSHLSRWCLYSASMMKLF